MDLLTALNREHGINIVKTLSFRVVGVFGAKGQSSFGSDQQKLEALVLAAILNVLNRLTDDLSVVSQQKKM
jgi:hypothetical protein